MIQAAEMAEIEAELGNKPDIVRLVHTNRWKLFPWVFDFRTRSFNTSPRRQPEPKYRNDQNVIEGVKAEYRLDCLRVVQVLT